MKQEIRFCSADDGVRIAYSLAGRGTPVVKAANWLNHLEFDWESPIWRHTLEPIARRHSLVRYDARGNGLSDWDVPELSFDAFVRDLETVADAAELERFALFGISQGCSVSIEYAVRHPERVSRLVLYGGYPQGWHVRGDKEDSSRREALHVLMETGWGRDNPAFRQIFTSLFIPGANQEQMSWFNDLQRVTTSPENAVRLWDAIGKIDVKAALERVTVPTLVIHARRDETVPFKAGRALAAGIPDARFVPLESGNHLILGQEPAWETFIESILDFLDSPDPKLTDEERIAAKSNVLHTPTPGPSPAWSEADRIFDRALDVPPAERSTWLDAVCGSNDELRQRVERLLAASDISEDGLVTAGALTGPIGDEVASELTGEVRLAVGDAIGPYVVVGSVGRGGMGTVYRARHGRLERDVALKSLSRVMGAGDADLRRFEREAKLLASLDHPNIATVHDFLVLERRPYLVMELVEGPTLRDRLAKGPLAADEVTSIASQLLDALEEAHDNGIVHRDLKPSNIKLTARGRVKVLDFGLAKSVIVSTESGGDTKDVTTGTGMLLGTPGYMSPEQVRSEDVDVRADYWAFGCIVYEMLTGARAFAGRTVSESIASVLRDDVDWERVPESAPGGLVTLMRRCLERDPERRLAAVDRARSMLSDESDELGEPSAVDSWFWLVIVLGVAAIAALVFVLAT